MWDRRKVDTSLGETEARRGQSPGEGDGGVSLGVYAIVS